MSEQDKDTLGQYWNILVRVRIYIRDRIHWVRIKRHQVMNGIKQVGQECIVLEIRYICLGKNQDILGQDQDKSGQNKETQVKLGHDYNRSGL